MALSRCGQHRFQHKTRQCTSLRNPPSNEKQHLRQIVKSRYAFLPMFWLLLIRLLVSKYHLGRTCWCSQCSGLWCQWCKHSVYGWLGSFYSIMGCGTTSQFGDQGMWRSCFHDAMTNPIHILELWKGGDGCGLFWFGSLNSNRPFWQQLASLGSTNRRFVYIIQQKREIN